jgi:hypothetical protein
VRTLQLRANHGLAANPQETLPEASLCNAIAVGFRISARRRYGVVATAGSPPASVELHARRLPHGQHNLLLGVMRFEFHTRSSMGQLMRAVHCSVLCTAYRSPVSIKQGTLMGPQERRRWIREDSHPSYRAKSTIYWLVEWVGGSRRHVKIWARELDSIRPVHQTLSVRLTAVGQLEFFCTLYRLSLFGASSPRSGNPSPGVAGRMRQGMLAHFTSTDGQERRITSGLRVIRPPSGGTTTSWKPAPGNQSVRIARLS